MRRQELDVDELIANREDMHSRLGSMTRNIQSRQFAGMPAGSSFEALLPTIEDQEHQEFLVTDGSKVLCFVVLVSAACLFCPIHRGYFKRHTLREKTICAESFVRFRLTRTRPLGRLLRLPVSTPTPSAYVCSVWGVPAPLTMRTGGRIGKDYEFCAGQF